MPRSSISTPNQLQNWTIHSNSFQNMMLLSNWSADPCFSGGCIYSSRNLSNSWNPSERRWLLKGHKQTYSAKLSFSSIQAICKDCGICASKERKSNFILELMPCEAFILLYKPHMPPAWGEDCPLSWERRIAGLVGKVGWKMHFRRVPDVLNPWDQS